MAALALQSHLWYESYPQSSAASSYPAPEHPASPGTPWATQTHPQGTSQQFPLWKFTPCALTAVPPSVTPSLCPPANTGALQMGMEICLWELLLSLSGTHRLSALRAECSLVPTLSSTTAPRSHFWYKMQACSKTQQYYHTSSEAPVTRQKLVLHWRTDLLLVHDTGQSSTHPCWCWQH